MKKNEKKVGGIKGFFMWLFRMDRTITEVEASNEPAPDVPMSFGETVKHVEEETEKLDIEAEKEAEIPPFCETVKEDAAPIEKPNPKPIIPSVKQNLSKKYNPNVKRGKDGRFKSLK